MKKNNEEQYPELKVRMFGKFQITDSRGTLDAESVHSEMLICLMAYMVSHRDRGLTVQELIDVLWPQDESDNPAGALKNLIYRLRKYLNQTWGKNRYILTGRETYQWNPEISMDVDVEKFESCCKEVFESKDKDVRQENGKMAVELYRGFYLTELSSEYWVISLSAYYHSIYLSMVKKLAELLEQDKKYTELKEICRKTIDIEPLDEEIHCFLLRALIADNKQGLADEHYKETVKLLYDSLGVRPSRELEEIYEELQKIQHDFESSIDIIQKDLRESESSGAFLCEYGVFRKIYALEFRSSRRLGISVHMILMTVYLKMQIPKEEELYNRLMGNAMKHLEETLIRGLRSSDVICRYSANQFLIMLPACQYEDAKMVMNRIENNFYQSQKINGIILQYNIDEINAG